MKKNHFIKQIIKQTVYGLLKVSALRFAALFLIVAVIVSVMIVMTIDLLWDGRLNPELEVAGVITPFLDGLFIVIFIIAMLNELRTEIERRKTAEDNIRGLNEELEQKVRKRTKQLLEAQEELVRKEKLATLGQLSGSVGHELRNPLGIMSNAVYYLETVMSGADETVKEYLYIIRSEIVNSQRIITDLLDFSRVKTPQTQSITVNELIRQSLGKCTVPANVTLRLEIPDTLPAVKVDPLQIVQVFQNLITNAIQAMPDGGELNISARLMDNVGGALRGSPDSGDHTGSPLQEWADFIEISVTDTGEGISPENMNKLFQPLFTTKTRGIGLGLTVVKNLTEANGGKIEVKSEVHRGITFTVILPATVNSEGQ
jgi:signal transduction histidine kinase